MTAPVIGPWSVIYAAPGDRYMVRVWGPRAGCEIAFARLPAYWSRADAEDVIPWYARVGTSSTGLVLGPLGAAAGLALTLINESETAVAATSPTIIPTADLAKFPGARAGDYFVALFGTPSRPSPGLESLSIENMRWDLNAQGASGVTFDVTSPNTRLPETSPTASDIVRSDARRQTWDDTIRDTGESVRQGIESAGETVEETGGFLKALANPWVLVPVLLGVGAFVVVLVVIPAVLQVRVNR